MIFIHGLTTMPFQLIEKKKKCGLTHITHELVDILNLKWDLYFFVSMTQNLRIKEKVE